MPIICLITFLLCCIFVLLLTPAKYVNFIRYFSLIASFFVLLVVFVLVLKFNIAESLLKYTVHFSWSNFLNIYYSGGVDGVSLLFLLLTAFLIPFCILYSWGQFLYFFKELMLLLFLIEFLLFNFFFVSDLFFFSYFSRVFFSLCLF